MSKSVGIWVFCAGLACLLIFGVFPFFTPEPAYSPGVMPSVGKSWALVFGWWFGGLGMFVGAVLWLIAVIGRKNKR